MSERSYGTLPRNFTFQTMQPTPIHLDRCPSMISLNGEYGFGRFGSVPANLQTIPIQRVISVPAYAGQYPYTPPSRPSSQFSYHMPTYPINVPVSCPIAWGRRASAFYSTPSPNGSESTYSTSQMIPLSYTNPPNFMIGSRKLNGAFHGSALSSNENKVTKIQLANKLELEEITLRKKSESDFIGLIIEVLPESLDQDVILVVSRIISGGLCQKDGKLQHGDRILKVNGHRIKDMDTTMEHFRSPNITLTIARATKQFKRDNIRIVSCNPLGHKPLPKGTKKLTTFIQGTPRMAKGVNEAKLEVEMISLCHRLERVRTGIKKAQWHLYNIDKEEFMSKNNDEKSIKNHKKKATKDQSAKKKRSKSNELQLKVLDKPLSKQPNEANENESNNQMPTYQPPVRVVQPYPYWVPLSHPVQPMMGTMPHATMPYPSFQNGSVYPQRFAARSNSLPNPARLPIETGSSKASPNAIRRSSVYEETLL